MILIPLPHYGFDPTEASIPWKFLTKNKEKITFATPDGLVASADDRMVRGTDLGIFKKLLMARPEAVNAYHKMIESDEFLNPISYSEIKTDIYEAILLPGGHDKGMIPYLESKILQGVVAEFFTKNKLVGAICHGTVLACRASNKKNNKSVLYGYKTTALLKSQEMSAYYLTCLWLKDYYRTYKITVEDEVKSTLKNKNDFLSGRHALYRDDQDHMKKSFIVEDRNYLSARWPGDAHKFALNFYQKLNK